MYYVFSIWNLFFFFFSRNRKIDILFILRINLQFEFFFSVLELANARIKSEICMNTLKSLPFYFREDKIFPKLCQLQYSKLFLSHSKLLWDPSYSNSQLRYHLQYQLNWNGKLHSTIPKELYKMSSIDYWSLS